MFFSSVNSEKYDSGACAQLSSVLYFQCWCSFSPLLIFNFFLHCELLKVFLHCELLMFFSSVIGEKYDSGACAQPSW